MRLKVTVFLLSSVALSGCVTPQEVVNPDAITLRQAVNEVAGSLHEVRDRYKNEPRVGMYPSGATVTFNISAGSTETTGLQVGATVPAAVSPIPLTLSASDQVVATATRGNQITIKFVNLLDHPPTLTRPGAPAAPKPKPKPEPKPDPKPAPAPKPEPAKPEPTPPGQQSGQPDWYKCFGQPPYPDYCNAIAFSLRLSPEQFKQLSPTEQRRWIQQIKPLQ